MYYKKSYFLLLFRYYSNAYPAHLESLADLAYEAQQKVSIPTNGRADDWPVRPWQQQAKTYRAWIQRLERAIKKAP